KWRPEYSEALRGRPVAILVDNDDAGRSQSRGVAAILSAGVVTSVKVIELPGLAEHGDVSDWLDAGRTREQLLDIVEATEVYRGNGAVEVGQDAGEPPIEEPASFSIVTPRDSFVTKYLAHMEKRTDAPLAAHELMAFGILSALAGPKIRIPLATSTKGFRLVLWPMYIVNSTEGRKTTVVEFGRDVVKAVLGDRAILVWEGS